MPVIRISYYDKNRTALLSGPVRQAVESLRDLHPDDFVFLRSGWLQGPHLDICVLPDRGQDLSRHMDLIQAWIDQHPSQIRLEDEVYDRQSRRLGALEGVDGPYLPLRPDNGAEIADYRQPRLVDGHYALQDAYVHFFHAAAPVVLMLADLRDGNELAFTVALLAMLSATTQRLRSDSGKKGFVSLQAHADFFFANYDADGKARAQFDAIRMSHHALFQAAVLDQNFAGLSGGTAATVAGIARAWDGVLDTTEADVKRRAEADSSWFYYTPAAFPDANEPKYRQAFADAGMADTTIKRGRTLETIDVDSAFFSSPEFQIFRIILNMFYSMLPSLSVSPMERFGLCYIVSNLMAEELAA